MKALFSTLTPREAEILRLFSEGKTVREVARKTGISAYTVRNHTQAILRKLEAHTKLEAVVMAFRSGWIKV